MAEQVNTSRTVAIIGAGCSGLAAAHTLQDMGYKVTLFEKTELPGGRATTSQQAGFIYDPGAQHIKRGHAESIDMITQRFWTPDLIDISKPTWIFDQTGNIQEGNSAQNAEPKWCYRSGLITLAQLMAATLDIRYQTSITSLEREGTGWRLFRETEPVADLFDYLLLSLPAGEALELMHASSLPHELKTTIVDQLTTIQYAPLLSIILGYNLRLLSRPYYALVNTDRGHTISWLAWEHEKAPERAPENTGLLIAQMSPQYSEEHWHTPNVLISRDVNEQVAALISEVLPAPFFTDVYRWRYALPITTLDVSKLHASTLPFGLAFCGDGYIGGRIHLAMEQGIQIARSITK